jgi:O-antigen ligase
MSVGLIREPFHAESNVTHRTASSQISAEHWTWVAGCVLFISALAATLSISSRDPLAAWGYGGVVFLLAGICALRGILREKYTLVPKTSCLWLVIGAWGIGQLAVGATEYRYATWDASVRLAALTATAFVAQRAFYRAQERFAFLHALGLAGFGISLLAALNRLTSGGAVLWIFPSTYPDVWGPFLSRNDFAAFVELCLPVVFWMSAEGQGRRATDGPNVGRAVYFVMAAAMVAIVFFSASRAGSALVALEAAVALWMIRCRKTVLLFIACLAAFTGLLGIHSLAGRLMEPDPIRLHLLRSTFAMIADRPWKGFGLGTYSVVYPAYATFDAGAVVEHAHNQWLEWAAEGGIPYLALWILLAVSVLPRAIRSRWGIGVVAVFLHALVDYPFARLGITAWTFSLIGILSVDEMREVGTRTH